MTPFRCHSTGVSLDNAYLLPRCAVTTHAHRDADINRILADSVEQAPVVHLAPNPFEHLISGKPRKPMRRKSREQREAEAAAAAAEVEAAAQKEAQTAAAAAQAGEDDEEEHGNGNGNGNGNGYYSSAKSPSAAAAKR